MSSLRSDDQEFDQEIRSRLENIFPEVPKGTRLTRTALAERDAAIKLAVEGILRVLIAQRTEAYAQNKRLCDFHTPNATVVNNLVSIVENGSRIATATKRSLVGVSHRTVDDVTIVDYVFSGGLRAHYSLMPTGERPLVVTLRGEEVRLRLQPGSILDDRQISTLAQFFAEEPTQPAASDFNPFEVDLADDCGNPDCPIHAPLRVRKAFVELLLLRSPLMPYVSLDTLAPNKQQHGYGPQL